MSHILLLFLVRSALAGWLFFKTLSAFLEALGDCPACAKAPKNRSFKHLFFYEDVQQAHSNSVQDNRNRRYQKERLVVRTRTYLKT